MKVENKDIVFLSGVRTPFGSFGGSLKSHSATDLGVVAAKGAIDRAGIEANDVDHVIFGNALQTSADALYLARHVGLRSGVPQEVPGLTLNRLCGSGFQSIVSGAEQILLGQGNVMLCGGAESMSQAPFTARNIRWGVRFGKDDKLSDTLWDALYDPFGGCAMGQTAENVGNKYEITREQCDEYGFRSQMAYKAALEAGKYADEVVPVTIKKRRQEVSFSDDECPRLEASLEKMQKLPSVFAKGGLVSPGNASAITDGAAAVVIADGAWAQERGHKSLGKLVAWGISGCDPTIMGIGPVPSSRKALAAAGMTIDQMDLIEVNEAFAAQYLAVEKELGLNRDITNVNGGAISVGHPLAASGTRITLHLLHELRRRGQRFGLGTACIGGGQGIAVIVEANLE
jgi:acetyl-CoA acyltransferase 2